MNPDYTAAQPAVRYSPVMVAGLPRVVVTHWVQPEVAAYLKEFSVPVVPPEDPGVWPAARILELAGGRKG